MSRSGEPGGETAARADRAGRRRLGRPPVEPHLAVARRKILDAAEALFAERGFDATPTSAIARRAGVTSALIFYYFRTKGGLLEALIDERTILPRFAALVQEADAEDPGELLRATGSSLFDLAHRSGPMIRIVVREVLKREALKQRWEESLEGAVRALAERISASPLATPPARAAALSRLFFNAITFQALFGPDLERERVIAEAVEVALRAA